MNWYSNKHPNCIINISILWWDSNCYFGSESHAVKTELCPYINCCDSHHTYSYVAIYMYKLSYCCIHILKSNSCFYLQIRQTVFGASVQCVSSSTPANLPWIVTWCFIQGKNLSSVVSVKKLSTESHHWKPTCWSIYKINWVCAMFSWFVCK